MKNGEYQPELFSEYTDKRRRLRPPQGFAARSWSVTLSLERLLFVGIGILVALVIVYALGVERGRASPHGAGGDSKRAGVSVRPAPAVPQKAAPAEATKPASQRAVRLQPAAPQKPAARAPREWVYTVLAATFSQQQLAQAAYARLQAEGEDPFLMVDRGFTQLYAGRFSTLKAALAAEQRLRAQYNDCIVRKFREGFVNNAASE